MWRLGECRGEHSWKQPANPGSLPRGYEALGRHLADTGEIWPEGQTDRVRRRDEERS